MSSSRKHLSLEGMLGLAEPYFEQSASSPDTGLGIPGEVCLAALKLEGTLLLQPCNP